MTDSNDCDELAERVALEHSAEERGAMARKPQCKICTRFTEEGSEYCAEHNLKADLADILSAPEPQIDPNDMAFPDPTDSSRRDTSGLTKREYFAGKMLEGAAEYKPEHHADMVRCAVLLADALIAELNKKASDKCD